MKITLIGGRRKGVLFLLLVGLSYLADAQIDPTIVFNDIVTTYGDPDFDLLATSNSDGTIRYEIDGGDTGAVVLSGTDNETVTIISAGVVQIRADQAMGIGFNPGSETMTLTINKATVDVTADDQSRDYGDSDPAFTITYDGTDFKNGETSSVIDTDPTGSTTATATSGVGDYTISLSGGLDVNYDFNFTSGTLTINKATVDVTADDKTREYGDGNPSFTISYDASDFKNGETSTEIDADPTASNGSVATTDAGDYTIGVSGGTDNNYDFNYIDGTLTITKATVGVTADDKSREYGDLNPSFTITYEAGDFKNGETSAEIDADPTASNGSVATTDAGDYAISVSGGTDNNYDFSFTSGTLTINKATVDVTADDKTREYGDLNPSFTITYEAGDFKNGETSAEIDTDPTASTAAIVTSDVGDYAITASGGSDTNYDFSFTSGTLTINKATVDVTADDQSRDYGDSDPTFTITYDGTDFKNGETSSVIDTDPMGSTTATATSGIGDYTISLSGGLDVNYDFNFTSGTLTINKATVDVTADDKTREYGDGNPSFTISYDASDFKNGETSTEIDADPTASNGSVATTDAGDYAISVSGGTDNNYDFNYIDGTLTITKATVGVTADDKSREYGDLNPSFTITYEAGDFKNGETSTEIDTDPTASTTATVTSDVGDYGITVSGGLDTNYDFSFTSGTLTINKATVDVTADDQSRDYGDSDPTFTITYDGTDFKNGETSAEIDTDPTASTTATVTSDVGDYPITSSGGSDTNYDFNFTSGTLTINKATVDVTADDKSREYGDTNPSFTISYDASDFKNGETSTEIDADPTASTAAIVTSDVGDYPITASGGTDNNYDFNYIDGTLTITKATVGVTADDKSREYGDLNPSFTITYEAGDFKNGETSAEIDTDPTASTAAIVTSDVGDYAITASGGSDTNYDFSFTSGTLTINKATVDVTADDKTREYGDGNPSFTISYDASDFKNGETSTEIDADPTASNGSVATTDAGDYAISVSGGTDNNYDFNYIDGTLTITKATVGVTADDKSREYGDLNPSFTITYEAGDFKNGETSAEIDTDPTASTAAIVTSDVGDYAITASGGSDTNYDFSFTSGTLTINKATVDVTADDQSRDYGDSDPTFTITYDGTDFKNGETSSVIDTDPTGSTTATATSGIGDYAITASGGSDTNYDFSFTSGTLTINKATVDVTADDKTREYGDGNPSFTISYDASDFKNGETSTEIDADPTASNGSVATTDAGDYAISVSGGTDNNYDFNYIDGTLTITKATVGVTADDKSREYGDLNPSFTITYEAGDFKNGETSAEIDTDPTASTAAIVTSDVGDYAITANGGSDTNYDFSFTSGTLTINKATVDVTADDQSRDYGDSDPTFTITYDGTDFKNGETSSVIDTDPMGSTTATATSGIGDYTISLSGGLDVNYDFNFTSGTLTINKATVDVTADDKTREYGDGNPSFTISYDASDFKNGETSTEIDADPTASNGSVATTDAGDYAISVSGGTDNNYDFNYIDGTLTITKATVGVTADDKSREYGDLNPSFTITYEAGDFKNGETSAEIDTDPTASTATIVTSDVGDYAITASGGSDTNYDFSFTSGTLTINKATVDVTADDQSRDYGDSDPTFTITYDGTDFKNGETSSVIDTDPMGSTTATATSGIGDYTISLSGGLDVNYDFNFTSGTLTINKATVDVTADDKTREYGDGNPSFTISYDASDFKNGETSTEIDADPTASNGSVATTDAGDYAISVSGGTDNNYDFNYIDGTLTITKATVGVTADDKSREYGDLNPSFTITYEAGDFKNGETSAEIDTDPTASTAAIVTSDVGDYAITASGGSDTNYDFSFTSGTLTINKATVDVTADDQSRDYGDSDPAFTITYDGTDFKNGETSSVIDTDPMGSTTATATSGVGDYTISLSGGLDVNYDFNFTSGTLTINKATVDVTADDKTREYGDGNPSFTISYDASDFKNGETSTEIDADPTASTAAIVTSDVGDYPITASGGTDNNYDFNYIDGMLTIIKAPLSVILDTMAIGYTDQPDTILANIRNYIGFKNNEDGDVISGQATIVPDPGDYAIDRSDTVLYTAVGLSAQNYSLGYSQGRLAIYSWPFITQQPVDSSGCTGLPLEIFAKGAANIKASFQWQGRLMNNASEFEPVGDLGFVVTGENTPILEFTSIEESISDYEFRFMVSSQEGFGLPAVSDTITISALNSPPRTNFFLKVGQLIIAEFQDSLVTYQWYKNGEMLNGEVNQALYLANVPDFGVDSFSLEMCYEIQEISCCTICAVDSFANATQPPILRSLDFTIRPNPNIGEFDLIWENADQGTIQISIVSINGEIMYSEILENDQSTFNHFVTLPGNRRTGIYFITVMSENEVISEKIFVQ